ncbi:MAG: acetyl-CoA decarbonylase/synthase complex subunit gamma, partial [Dehalococcoidia bacterium]
SLTYFIISGEIEASKVDSYLLVKDTEGLSVMTAWAAGKFVADAIAPFVKKCGIADKVKHHKLVIPGYAASESGGLEEELPGWEILVGPRDGSQIPAYLKMWKP